MTEERPGERTGENSPDRHGEKEAEAERRRRRARVFGDVLPEATRDDRVDGWSEREPGPEDSDGQVPPHHGQ
jgi:hypothetical protein